MTTEEHNRTLGILHLVYGGLHALGALVMVIVFMFLGIGLGASGSRNAPEAAMVMMIFWSVFAFIWLLFSVPAFVAGYGLLKRKSWAKIWAMIAGGLAGMSVPLGTALCVYTFWFLFSGGGKQMYEQQSGNWKSGQQGVLHGAPEPANWTASARDRDYTYVPPTTPPDWRGE